MSVAALTLAELRARLRGGGLLLRVPPFAVRVRSDLDSVAEHLQSLYAAFDVLGEGGFVDFDVAVRRASLLRRWIRPQVSFFLDDHEPFKPLPEPQAAPLLEWGLNWSIANRPLDMLVVHAAVLERGGRALVMPGAPGSGKSTLCAALAVHEGWRLLSDELALIRISDSLIVPIPRPVSLKNESIELIRALAPPGFIGRVYPDTRKGTLSHMRVPDASVTVAGTPARGRWIVFPRFRAGAGASVEPLSRGTAFLRMADQSFNREALGAVGFHTMCRMFDGAGCWDIEYGSLDQAFESVRRICAEP